MGNSLSLETNVLPGVPNPSAKKILINNHYTVGDIYAARCTTNSGARCTVAIFHGNMEDFAATQAMWRRLKSTCLVGFEYPGYGWRTEESSTQAGILADIPKQVSYLKDKGRVIVVGRSLGRLPHCI
jgi:hypothetical protein